MMKRFDRSMRNQRGVKIIDIKITLNFEPSDSIPAFAFKYCAVLQQVGSF